MIELTRQSGSSSRGKSGLPNPSAQPPKCPHCGSQKIWKDGFRYIDTGDIQRYVCRECGYRFSIPQNLNTDLANYRDRRVCVSLAEGTKNLVRVETRTGKRAAGATKPIAPEVKGKLVEFLWWLKKNGYRKSTIETKVKLLKILAKREGDLFDPESIKLTIAKQQWCTKRKANAVDAYTSFLKMRGVGWEPPKYKPVHKLPFIPQENEIDQLIAGCGNKTATLLQLLKETGMRIGEAANLEWIDIDFEKRLVRITPEKGSRPRILQISRKLCLMFKDIQKPDKN